MTDIAVLGEPDGQRFPGAAKDYRAALAEIEPVPLCVDDFPVLRESVPVHLLTRTQGWLAVEATQVNVRGDVSVLCWEELDRLDVGSPIVTEDGRLVGVMTHQAGPMVLMARARVKMAAPPGADAVYDRISSEIIARVHQGKPVTPEEMDEWERLLRGGADDPS